ncbi:hypothetical protein TNCV_1151391 [Trichonephila clavipes]|nr:hypothetical protein TNCV_1151391 [Trichonephila clavipes]
MCEYGSSMLGGLDVIVEIDVSIFGKRMCNTPSSFGKTLLNAGLINSFKSGKRFGLHLYTLYLGYQQNQKSIGVMSGDRRGHINRKYVR